MGVELHLAMERQGLNDHATLVAGIMIAAGVDHGARGMAYQANLLTFDFNNGVTEMTTEAGNGAVLSNHSYGESIWLGMG